MKRLFIPLIGALILSGCWNGRVLLSFEQPFWSSIGGGVRAKLSLAVDSLTTGYFPRVMLAPPGRDPAETFVKDVSAGGYRAVVVGPLLSFEWHQYASRFPDTRFILIGPRTSGDFPPNATLLRYDRAGPFRSAGYAAGVSIREEQAGGPQSARGHRIAILTGSGSELSPDETSAFSAGVAEALDGEEPLVRQIDNPADKTAVKASIEALRGEGVEIFLVGLGAADPWCLEVMHDAGGCAVVEGWAVSGVFPLQVFLSVEEDIPAGIREALGTGNGRAREVNGPVRLVAGKARAIPDAARARAGGG